MTQNKRKVIIVGEGLSGLTSGTYLLDNGYDVEIYEKGGIPQFLTKRLRIAAFLSFFGF